MSSDEGQTGARGDERPWVGTVDAVSEHTVLLDFDGVLVKLPRELFRGASVREGDGFSLTLASDPGARERLQRSVAMRIAALSASGPAPGPAVASSAPPAGFSLGAMPGAAVVVGSVASLAEGEGDGGDPGLLEQVHAAQGPVSDGALEVPGGEGDGSSGDGST